MLATPAYDVALILNQGQRETQEDAIAARMFDASDAGYVVIADGMGGHDAGEVASEMVISAWRDALDAELEAKTLNEGSAIDALPLAAMQANAAIANHNEAQGQGFNMGSTLLGVLLLGQRVFWISIGDSPLFLFRDNTLTQINEDHSMAPVIDAKLSAGEITEADARDLDRNQLTSVIMGGGIPKVDCPERPMQVTPADILILGSDGLQYLSDAEIQSVLSKHQHSLAQDIAEALLLAVQTKDDPDQDNLSIAVAKFTRT
ncbi:MULTISPECIES: PP2C family serine/threonine-protein phosphatase [unclassified Ruegeria]|uniref:PP2C family protein-serine/threonine phosphatase n=1 Tax=unclassified Ruegeria TaxID=2625375 RepID=UPI001491F994|nr:MULTISPECIES: protein phosphatase 2C domain-containing protein [unclassified Ruegeria]NOD88353.1 SpoIIE family protein phosphatase [Ruegeria sp. HKCCD4318]NOE13262.1 SpoIIE family protein phosphatase [Ruegeria sp. HKCCD4318-2]NOG11196.1 protein serine/threonine phosphatase 2C family protein [Ruegeria sp. HKCCD4315]